MNHTPRASQELAPSRRLLRLSVSPRDAELPPPFEPSLEAEAPGPPEADRAEALEEAANAIDSLGEPDVAAALAALANAVAAISARPEALRAEATTTQTSTRNAAPLQRTTWEAVREITPEPEVAIAETTEAADAPSPRATAPEQIAPRRATPPITVTHTPPLEVVVVALTQQHLRCAFCHGPLRHPEAESCGDCRTLLHRECASGLKACPTLGCANKDLRARQAIHVTLERLWGRLVLAAVVLPLIALVVDYHLHVNPLIWGELHFLSDLRSGGCAPADPGLGVALRMAVVYVGGVLSATGVALLAAGRPRPSLPLLALGVVYSGAHALAFTPLLPISLTAVVLVGLGLLGFTPFLALPAYFALFERARLSVLRSTPGVERRPPWLAERFGLARVVVAFLASVALAGGLYFGLKDLGREPRPPAWQASWSSEVSDETEEPLDSEWIKVESHDAPARGNQAEESSGEERGESGEDAVEER